MRRTLLALLGFMLLSAPLAATALQFGDYTYAITKGNAITITRYTGTNSTVTVPDTINGLPVTSIGQSAFASYTLANVTIPGSIESVGQGAFFCIGSLTNVIILEGVKKLDSFSFANCSRLSNVTLPDSISDIGYMAFYGDNNLTNCTISGRVITIGEKAFYGCSSLNELTIPASVTSLGNEAFRYCNHLTNVAIFSPVILTNAVFSDCTRLADLTITNVTSIGNNSFSECGALTSVSIPSSVTNIGGMAFSGCSSLATAVIPQTVTSIGTDAFYNCSNLVSITVHPENAFYSDVDGVLFDHNQHTLIRYPGGMTGDYVIPSTVTNILGGAFRNSPGLTGVTIPSSVTTLGGSVFASCANLGSVTMAGGIDTISYGSFMWCYSLTNVTIPDGVTIIGDTAFCGCTNLTSVTIPNGVTLIGRQAFSYCDKLTSITFPSSVTRISDYAFGSGLKTAYFMGNAPSVGYGFYSSTTAYYLPGTTGWGATLGDCPTAPWIDITDFNYVTNDNAISITGYRGARGYVVIPSTINDLPVTSIGDYAFLSCQSLTNVTVPGTVTHIGFRAFSECFNLTNITVHSTNAAYCSVDGILFDKKQTTLIQCPGGRVQPYTVPGSVTTIADCAFEGCMMLSGVTISENVRSIGDSGFASCNGLTGVSIPFGVTSIGKQTFFSCLNLTNVTISGTVTNIGESAFACCSALAAINVDVTNPAFSSLDGVLFDRSQTTLIACPAGKVGSYTIPSSISNFGFAAFQFCTSLTSVTIPSSISTIREYTFYNCTGLTGVNVANGVTSIGYMAFCNCASLTNITIPNSVTNIDSAAFAFCSRLASVAVPGSITRINGFVFHKCTSLTNVIISYGVLGIGYMAFDSCSNLTTVTIPESVNRIEDRAFAFCTRLANVTIPSSVSWIGESAFLKCSNLKRVMFQGYPPMVGSTVFDSDCRATAYYLPGAAERWGQTFAGLRTAPLCGVHGDLDYTTNANAITIIGYVGQGGEVVIPGTIDGLPVTCIADGAFRNCPSPISIRIPKELRTLEMYAFRDCTNLIAFTVDDENESFSSADGILFNKDQTTLIQCPSGKIEAHRIPETVTSIGVDSFAYCTSLTSVTIPGSVTNIGTGAFMNCVSLASITIPNSVTQIGGVAFYSPSLKSIFFKGNPPSLGPIPFYTYDTIAYYLPKTTGWGTMIGDIPALLWNPQIQTSDPSFGPRTNGFGFKITGTTNIPIVVEACTSLTDSDWVPLQTNTLSDGCLDFTDDGSSPHGRFYRIRSP